ncbi:MAG TPA: hypothetical protein VGF99_03815, partial [Myxococcota bacterium]
APKADPKKADDKKTDPKKTDDKKADPKKADDKKADPKKSDAKVEDKKTTSSRAPDDILEETEEDKKKRAKEDAARQKAEAAAAAEEAKKAAEKARLAEEKKQNADKKLQATRDARLASAKAVRTFRRDEGEYSILAEVEPGAVVKGKLVEVRLDVFKRLDVADPRFGNREPAKAPKLVANVIEPTGKKDATTSYALHPLSAPGHYGFHFTPSRDGVVNVQISGTVGERTVNSTLPLHIGVWPPPDFDNEDKKLATAAP